MPESDIVVFAENNLHPFYDAVLGELNPVEMCSCEAGFDWWKRGKAEVAVIDCGYRVEVGLDLLRGIKNASPRTIVVFIAEVSTEETVIQAFTSGVRAYLRKPFSVPELQGLLKNFLAVKKESKEERVHIAFDENPPDRKTPDVRTDKPVQLLRALRYMKENLENPLDLAACAREAGLSKYHFARAFKRHFGMTPMLFLQLLRVNRAKDLLLREDLNLGEIASMTGFTEQRRFTKAFKKLTGVGPKAYRNSARNEQ
jgi:AraC-like DNA-binding protein